MQKNHSLFIAIATGFVFFLLNVSAQAITLGFDPVSQNVYLGDSVSVDLVISELGDGMADSLSTFDLIIDFDETILSFSSVTFGDPILGDQLDLLDEDSFYSDTAGVDTVNIYELSFDSPSDLNSSQASSFTLATLTFDANEIGTSPLGYSAPSIPFIVLGDATGAELSSKTTFSTGSITVIAPIPEPASIILFSTGMLLLTGLRRRSGK